MPKQPLTTAQLAAELRVSVTYINHLADSGRITPLWTLPNGYRLYKAGTKLPRARKAGRPAKR